MLYMSYTFGTVLAIEYLTTLLNLTTANSPMSFPSFYPIFPEIVDGVATSPYFIPLILKSEFLRTNLEWTSFFTIDLKTEAT
jgi:hypothetical protein